MAIWIIAGVVSIGMGLCSIAAIWSGRDQIEALGMNIFAAGAIFTICRISGESNGPTLLTLTPIVIWLIGIFVDFLWLNKYIHRMYDQEL